MAKPPGGPQPADGPQPVDPPLARLCASYPHPLATCSAVAVSCPSTAKAQVACKTVASAGAANAPVQKLELQLPRAYVALKMLCQLKPGSAIACRITSRTRTSATGVRVMVLRLRPARPRADRLQHEEREVRLQDRELNGGGSPLPRSLNQPSACRIRPCRGC